MAVKLTKGGNLNLSKESVGLKTLCVGLGWDARVTDGKEFDLDAVAFLVDESGKVRGDGDFVFFSQKESACGSVTHTGDNLTGEGDGDDEQLLVNLEKVPADVTKIVFAATIYEAETREQNFGQVSTAYIQVTDTSADMQLAIFDLSEDASLNTAMVFGELYQNNGDWKFKAIGQGFDGGLKALAASYGVSV